MAEQSLIVSMWQEILENYAENGRHYERDRDISGLFTGGGEEAVKRLETKLGFELPREFADYVRFYCPNENLSVGELIEATSLIAFDNLAEFDYNESYGIEEMHEMYREGHHVEGLERGDDLHLLIFAEDTQHHALAANIKDKSCPVYSYDAGDGPQHLEQIAPNFAHGLYLLGYHQRLNVQGEDRGLDRFSSEWKPIIATFQAKLDVLAPGVKAEQWHFYEYP